MQERVRGLLNHVELLALLFVEVGSRHELRHSDDAVHGRADFVTHVGEKLALRTVGTFRRFLCGFQLRARLREIPRPLLDADLELVSCLGERLPALLDLAEHLIKGIGKRAELVGRQLPCPGRVVAAADGARDIDQLAHRTGELTDGPGRRHERDDQGRKKHAEADEQTLSQGRLNVGQAPALVKIADSGTIQGHLRSDLGMIAAEHDASGGMVN